MGLRQRQRRDIYYKMAREMGYRSRSALKLLQIHQTLKILKGFKKAVDLCASPGGFAQMLLRFSENTEVADFKPVLAIDVQPMHEIDGVQCWVRDITEPSLAQNIVDYYQQEKVDIVVCDGAPDSLGADFEDFYYQSDIVYSAMQLTVGILKEGSFFVAKVFRHNGHRLLAYRLSHFFESCVYAKPRACRQSSLEAYFVGTSFVLPASLKCFANDCEKLREEFWNFIYSIQEVPEDFIIEFVSCGDDLYDADANYPDLPEDFTFSVCPFGDPEHLALPTMPAYKTAVELKKFNKLAKVVHS